MLLTCHKPKPPLDQFVECFWLSLGYSPSHQMERVLPTGTVELVFDLRNDRIRIFDDESDVDWAVLGRRCRDGGTFPVFRFGIFAASLCRRSSFSTGRCCPVFWIAAWAKSWISM